MHPQEGQVILVNEPEGPTEKQGLLPAFGSLCAKTLLPKGIAGRHAPRGNGECC